MPTLNDHDGSFSKPAKMFAQIACFALVIAATFWHFMFISKVNFVTLAQIVSETQHQKKTFPLACNS